MKNLFFIALFVGLSTASIAQNVSDALRYSQRDPLGSARYVGVGGSMGAIGADFGSITDNPAGLAGYRFSEVVLSPGLYYNQTNSQLKSSAFIKENKYGPAVDNLGLVIVKNGIEGSNWRTVNFSFGYNKVADYNNQLYFLGNTTGSITDHWREQSLHVAPDDLSSFASGLAYEAGAIYDSNNDYVYESDFTSYANKAVTKSQLAKTKGYMSEVQFSLAGNYKDKLLIGAALVIPHLSYTEDKSYEESDPTNLNPVFENLRYTEFLKTKGSGLNLKLGVIFKLHDLFRLGIAFQTPSLIELTDDYETSLSYSYVDNGTVQTYDKQSPETGQYTYNLITPMRTRLSFGSVIAKNGFLGASVEYVNYSKAQFDFNSDQNNSSDIDYQNSLNDDIKKQYKSSLNYNLGAEIAIDALRLRGGVSLIGSPYENEKDFTSTYSAGLGYRGGRFFTDVAVRHSSYDDGYLPYTTASNDAQLVYSKHSLNRLVLTFGYKF
ncbi:MAG: hypothetical protein ABI761_12435 [Saprospiraceae bacterium]